MQRRTARSRCTQASWTRNHALRSATMGAMADQKAIAATITGRVQGVGYRYAAMAVAKELGLKGWVRNTPDGSVEAWAQGDDAVVGAFVEYLEQGPRSARVASVDVRSVGPDATLLGFAVRS